MMLPPNGSRTMQNTNDILTLSIRKACIAMRPGRALCLVLTLLLALSPCYAQEETATQPATQPDTQPAAPSVLDPALPTIDGVQAEMDQLDQVEGLDAAARAEAQVSYQRAIEQLKAAEDWRAKITAFEQAIQDAPARLTAAQQELESATTAPAVSAPSHLTFEILEQALATAGADLAAAKKSQDLLTEEAQRRLDRRTAVPALTAEAQQRLGKINEELAVAPKDGVSKPAAARRTLLAAQALATRAELDAYEKELASYEAERDLLVARVDVESWRITQGQKLQTELQTLVDAKRREKAVQDAQEAQDLAVAAKAYPALRELAEQNAQLTGERTGSEGVAAKVSRATDRLVKVSATLGGLEQDLKSLRQKDKVVGKTPTYGAWLRKYQADLPDIHAYLQRARVRRSEMAEVQFRLIELREQRGALTDVNTSVEQVLANLDPSLPAPRRDRVAALARDLLTDHRENLDALVKDYDAYFTVLAELETKVQLLLADAKEIDSYISERVLWIRSADVIGWRDVTGSATALRWLLGREAWGHVGRTMWADIKSHPVGTAIWACIFGVFIAMRRRIVRGLGSAMRVPKGATPRVLRVFVITVILAVTIPGLIWLVSWRLAVAPAHSEVVNAFSAGLKDMARVTFTLMLLLGVCLPNGLGRWYFDWRPGTTRDIRRWVLRLLVVLPGLVFLIASVQSQEAEAWQNSLGRIALVLALLALSLCALRLLRPADRVVARMNVDGRHARLWRFRYIGHVLVVGIPALLALLAVVGYYHTALHLTSRFTVSLWLVAGLFLFRAVVSRWLNVAYRRVAAQRYRRRKMELTAKASPDDSDGHGSVGLALEGSKASLDRANHRSHQLLRSVLVAVFIVSMWSIWSSSLPALRALDRVELWSHTVTVTVPVTTAEGQTIQEAVEELRPITLANVGLVVMVIILTVVAATDVPAFLEMAVIQRIHRDIGVQHAIIAVLRYVVIVAGIILAFHLLGIGWSTVQWLVAAMTVGLGFGLQEIFANFISGLIILFERPIRIGDTVTIGDTVGTVTRIRIRATTVTDWDRKELIVPNKEFITGRLINWTLSDKVLRIIIRVGIAYGSDTKLAEEVLYKTAREHPFVLDDPAPVVLFKEFGNSSLNFDLRVYIDDIEHYFPVWHDLHMGIDTAFREAGVTIAFPQRDTHLKTNTPLEIRLLADNEPTPGDGKGRNRG